jgi:hypothetical protein
MTIKKLIQWLRRKRRRKSRNQLPLNSPILLKGIQITLMNRRCSSLFTVMDMEMVHHIPSNQTPTTLPNP